MVYSMMIIHHASLDFLLPNTKVETLLKGGNNEMSSILETIEIQRECKLAEDTVEMVIEVDNYLRPLYSPECCHGFKPYQLEDPNIHFMVVRKDGKPIACGGVKLHDSHTDSTNDTPAYTEVKRMYVRPGYRGLGLAKYLLSYLERLTLSLGCTIIRLETGIYQPDAIALYEKVGYQRCAVFGDYRESLENLFYEKILAST